MTTEKREILDDINGKLSSKINELVYKLPNFHTIDDGFIVRLFTKWDYCDDNSNIKYKVIKDVNDPEKKSVFFYIPKNATFNYDEKFTIKNITCLSGGLILDTDNTLIEIKQYTKIDLNLNKFSGRALENTYLVASDD